MADDENKTPNKVAPVRSSLRELPGTAQVFANLESHSQPRRFYYAQLGEPLCHRGTTDYTDVTDGTFELRHTFVIRHLAFGIFQTIPTESSPQTMGATIPCVRFRKAARNSCSFPRNTK